MKKKGVDVANQCQIFKMCNPQKAKQVLDDDMDLNIALPCRISVYSDRGQTKIGMFRPTALLASLTETESLRSLAERDRKKRPSK